MENYGVTENAKLLGKKAQGNVRKHRKTMQWI